MQRRRPNLARRESPHESFKGFNKNRQNLMELHEFPRTRAYIFMTPPAPSPPRLVIVCDSFCFLSRRRKSILKYGLANANAP